MTYKQVYIFLKLSLITLSVILEKVLNEMIHTVVVGCGAVVVAVTKSWVLLLPERCDHRWGTQDVV